VGVEVKSESEFLSLNADRRADLFYHAFQESPDGLVIVGPRGTVLYANAQAETLFGYRAEEMMDRSVEMLIPVHMRDRHVADREGYIAHAPVPRTMGRGVPLFGRRKNGSEFPAEIALSPIEYNGEVYVLAAVRNASEWVRLDTLESRIYQPLARLAGLRQAKAAMDRATEEALEDLLADLTPRAAGTEPMSSRAEEEVQDEERA
jgi:PAS domain S-box-containing protein